MTTIDAAAAADAADRGSGLVTGLARWATTTDHKRIGRMFISTSLVMVVVAIVTATVFGIDRLDAASQVFEPALANELFQAMRIGQILGVLAPIGLGLAVAVVPLQIGARALAFARLALAGYYAWLAGIVLIAVALFNDGAVGGGDVDMLGLFLLGNGMVVSALVAVAIAVATTALTARAPGMTLRRVPLFTWSALVGAIGAVVALPVALGSLVYFYVDARYDGSTFGGTSAFGELVGWLYTQPMILVLALPAVGVFAEIVPVTFRTRQPLRSAVLVGIGLVGLATMAAVARQQVVGVANGDPPSWYVTFGLFHLVPLLGLVAVFAAAALAAKPGRPRVLPKITGAFLFSFFGFGMILVGAVAGVVHSVEGNQLVGTVFEEGATVYIVYGALLGVLGGWAWWAPKWSGRRLPEPAVFGLALLGVLATILASLPYLIAGFAGQPAAAQVFDYEGPMQVWNGLVLAGHVMMGLTVIGFALLVLRGAGSVVGDDPYDAQTIEWTTGSPAPADNFHEVPVITSAEPLLDMKTAHRSTGGVA